MEKLGLLSKDLAAKREGFKVHRFKLAAEFCGWKRS